MNGVGLLKLTPDKISGLSGQGLLLFTLPSYFCRVNSFQADGHMTAKDLGDPGDGQFTGIPIIAGMVGDVEEVLAFIPKG